MSYQVQVRHAAELDVGEALLWYEAQQSGLGSEFHSEVSQVIETTRPRPLSFIKSYIMMFAAQSFIASPYLIWYRVVGEVVTVLACTSGRQDPEKVKTRFE